jgi:hypothetical protein
MTVPVRALPLRALALILLVLAIPLCLIALGAAAGLVALPYPLWLVEQRLPMLFRVHMASAGLALVAVPTAVSCYAHSVHRLVGRSAAALVLVGGATALPVALASEAHWLAQAGFLVQALAWIGLALAGVRAIRRGERARHLWLMLAVAAIASGAVWLRLATWAAVQWRDWLDFDAAYAAAAWLSWMTPLGVVALLAQRGADRHAAGGPRLPSIEEADPSGHHRRESHDQHHGHQLVVDDGANLPQSRRAHVGHLARLHRRAPAQELPGRNDGGEPDEDEQAELGEERPGVEVVGGALLEVEHACEPHDEQGHRRDAVDHVGDLKLARALHRQRAPDEHELDHQRGE